jgi:hypothetical protein
MHSMIEFDHLPFPLEFPVLTLLGAPSGDYSPDCALWSRLSPG